MFTKTCSIIRMNWFVGYGAISDFDRSWFKSRQNMVVDDRLFLFLFLVSVFGMNKPEKNLFSTETFCSDLLPSGSSPKMFQSAKPNFLCYLEAEILRKIQFLGSIMVLDSLNQCILLTWGFWSFHMLVSTNILWECC